MLTEKKKRLCFRIFFMNSDFAKKKRKSCMNVWKEIVEIMPGTWMKKGKSVFFK